MVQDTTQDSDDDDFIPLDAMGKGSVGGPEEKDVEVGRGSRPPWYRESSMHLGYPYKTLHNEVLDFCDMVLPTSEERDHTAKALSFVKEAVRSIFGNLARVEVFGSQLTGLALPSSDLDVVVLGGGHMAMAQVAKIMRRHGDAGTVINAKVPLVKFVYVATGRQVDICFDQESGLESGEAAKVLMRQMPPVRPLLMVLKQYLAQRTMNETYIGFVGSFLLQLMVVALVQRCGRKACAEGRQPPTNLGYLLDEFFDFYGNQMNFAATGITLLGQGGGGFFHKEQFGWLIPNKPFTLSVQNPHDPSVDVGANSYKIPEVQQSFRATSSRLKAAFQRASSSGRVESFLQYVLYPSSDLVARNLPPPLFTTKMFDGDCTEVLCESGGDDDSGEDDVAVVKQATPSHRGGRGKRKRGGKGSNGKMRRWKKNKRG